MKPPMKEEPVMVTMTPRQWNSLLLPGRMAHHDGEAQKIIRASLAAARIREDRSAACQGDTP